MVIFTYFVLFFLVLRFSVTLFNFLSNPKLPSFRPALTNFISIVITVRNGESNLLNLLNSIASQEYPHVEVIIYHSALDGSDLKLVDAVCEKDSRFRLKRGMPGDYAWVKDEIKGDYLLFLDSNIAIQKGFLNSLVYRLKVFKVAAVSIIPNQVFESFLQKLILPLSDFVLLNLVPLRLIKLLRSPAFITVNNSCCMFVDAALYRQQRWQEKVDAGKGDLDLLKVVKQDHRKAEVLLANKLVYQVSKVNRSELFQTATETFRLNFGSMLIEFIYLLLVVLGPLIVIIGFDFYIIILPLGLIFLSRVMISFMTGQNPILNVLLHPLQMLMMLVLFVKGVQAHLLTSIKQNDT
jgi:glycosyltransferase involved in cell wall biosynthesis